jgi:subtilisin family serine protease
MNTQDMRSIGQRIRGFSIILLVFSWTLVWAQEEVVQIHGVKYAFKDGKWFAYVNNQLGTERIPDRIIVRRTDRDLLTDNDLVTLGLPEARLASPRFLEGYYVISATDSMRSFMVAQALSSSGLFDYVVLDGYGGRGEMPNDQYFGQQWNLDQTKLRMANAWDISKGNSSIIVDIIDTGCDYGHQDLAGNIWSSIGWDFVQNDNTPIDNDKHGTAVAGIIGARTNNSIGVAGIAGGWGSTQGVSLMILKDGEDEPEISLTAQAVQWAADHGVRAINISSDWPSDEPNLPVLQSAINYAVNTKDVVVVANAGNTGDDPNHNVRLPAAWPNVIAVGQTDQNDLRKPTSSYSEALDVVAPGEVYTTDIRGIAGYTSGDYYSSFPGTSASAPHVAGLAGLIRSVNSSLTWTQVHDIIFNSADKVPAMGGQEWTEEYGWGRLNAYQALLLTHAYSGKSVSSEAIGSNSARHLAKQGTSTFHQIFESGITSGGSVLGEIFYRKSTNDGSIWNTPIRLSTGNENNRYPCITERGGNIFAVWQRRDGSSHDVYFRKSTNGGTTWTNATELASNVGTSSTMPLPVIASPENNNLMAVYRSGNNLKWKSSTNNGDTWPTSGTISAASGEKLNSPSVTAAIAPWGSPRTGLAYATKEIPNASHIITRYHDGSA